MVAVIRFLPKQTLQSREWHEFTYHWNWERWSSQQHRKNFNEWQKHRRRVIGSWSDMTDDRISIEYHLVLERKNELIRVSHDINFYASEREQNDIWEWNKEARQRQSLLYMCIIWPGLKSERTRLAIFFFVADGRMITAGNPVSEIVERERHPRSYFCISAYIDQRR